MPQRVTTKTGDKGTTSLYSGERVCKSSSRVEAFGTIDEVNSWLGLIRASLKDEELKEMVLKIEEKMFVVGSELATISKHLDIIITTEDVKYLEDKIEYYKHHSNLINKFTIPGRSVMDGYFNIARTITRRAERRIIYFSQKENIIINKYLLMYVNRLSDLLYIVSRLDFDEAEN